MQEIIEFHLISSEAIVLAPDAIRGEVSSLPKRFGLNLKLDVVAVGSNNSDCEVTGTADALRLVHDKLTSPRIMVVSSDVVTDLQLHHLTDLHRVHRASVTSLFARQTLDQKSIPVPGPKSKPKSGA